MDRLLNVFELSEESTRSYQVIRITHTYGKNNYFYGVKTKLKIDELQLVCGYLEILRADLPVLAGIDDVLGEEDVINLLAALYDCEKIVVLGSKNHPNYQHKLDLHENWETVVNSYYSNKGVYSCGIYNRSEYFLKTGLARKGVYKAIINELIMTVEKSHQQDNDEAKNTIEQLNHILTGKPIPELWELVLIDNELFMPIKIDAPFDMWS